MQNRRIANQPSKRQKTCHCHGGAVNCLRFVMHLLLAPLVQALTFKAVIAFIAHFLDGSIDIVFYAPKGNSTGSEENVTCAWIIVARLAN